MQLTSEFVVSCVTTYVMIMWRLLLPGRQVSKVKESSYAAVMLVHIPSSNTREGGGFGIPYPLIRLFRTVVSGFETRLNFVLKVREQKSEKRLRDCLGGEHVHSRQNETFEAPDHDESLGLAHMSFCCCVLGVDTYVSGFTKTAGIPNARNHYILCDRCW